MKKSTNPNAKVSNPFGDLKGEKFGGDNNRLILDEGQVEHGITFVGLQKNVDLGSGPIDIYQGKKKDSDEVIGLPAAAVFRKTAEKANLQPGDVFSIARVNDAIKQKGKGKGKPMEVYQILVTARGKVKKSK